MTTVSKEDILARRLDLHRIRAELHAKASAEVSARIEAEKRSLTELCGATGHEYCGGENSFCKWCRTSEGD